MIFLEFLPCAIAVFTALYLVGVLVCPERIKRGEIFPVVGLVCMIFGTAMFSNLFGFSIPIAAGTTFGTAVIFKIMARGASPTWFKLDLSKYATGILAVAGACALAQTTSREFGVGNFDFMNAVQDGIYLTNRGALDSTITNHLLPLNWSAGIGSRYGISFIIGTILRFFPTLNPLLVSESILLVMFALGFLTLFSLLKTLTQRKNWIVTVASTIATISSMVIYQLDTQMFGQISVLPVVYLLFLLVLEFRGDRLHAVLILVTFITIFVLYPAICLPVGLSLLIVICNAVSKRGLNLNYLIYFILGAMVSTLLLFSSNLAWPFKMIKSFAAPQIKNSISNPQADLFPQMTSAIGPGQYFGVVAFPFSGRWNIFIVMWSLIWVVLIPILLFLISKRIIESAFKRSVIYSFFAAFYVFAIYAYVSGNSYVVLKIGTWTAPLLLSLFAFFSLDGFRDRRSIARATSLLVFIFLLANLGLAISEIGHMRNRSSTSFPQLIALKDSNMVHGIPFERLSTLGILTPTAEEASWVAVNAPQKLKDKILSLGPQNQALAEAERFGCNEKDVLERATNVQNILFSTSTRDIVPTPEVLDSAPSLFKFGKWKIQNIKDFKSFIFVSSGLFPPTLNYQISRNPIANSQALRWSSGRTCLIAYSTNNAILKLRIPFLLGPDAGKSPHWKSATAQTLTIENPNLNSSEIILEQKVKPGWNAIQFEMLNLRPVTISKFLNVRADARALRFALGNINPIWQKT